MSAAFVLDCSLSMAWAFIDEQTPETANLLLRTERETVIVPALWFLEISNTVVQAIRRKRISKMDADAFLVSMKELDKEIDAAFIGAAFDSVYEFAQKHKLTTYDATYLELAQRRKLPLASLDEPLRTAAASLGIPLLGK